MFRKSSRRTFFFPFRSDSLLFSPLARADEERNFSEFQRNERNVEPNGMGKNGSDGPEK